MPPKKRKAAAAAATPSPPPAKSQKTSKIQMKRELNSSPPPDPKKQNLDIQLDEQFRAASCKYLTLLRLFTIDSAQLVLFMSTIMAPSTTPVLIKATLLRRRITTRLVSPHFSPQITLTEQFYFIQLIKAQNGGSHYCHTRWGRVGESGKSNTNTYGSLEEAMDDFKNRFKEKTGLKWEDRLDEPKDKKYTYLQKNYDVREDAEVNEEEKPTVESKLPLQSQELIRFIFNDDHFQATMQSIGYVSYPVLSFSCCA
jgi:predicted DNA-binding WGR domain protein